MHRKLLSLSLLALIALPAQAGHHQGLLKRLFGKKCCCKPTVCCPVETPMPCPPMPPEGACCVMPGMDPGAGPGTPGIAVFNAGDCEDERQAFLAADAQLQASVVNREEKAGELELAEAATEAARLALQAAEAQEAAAETAYQEAEQLVTTSGAAAANAYQAYLQCLINDPGTPEARRIEAKRLLQLARESG